MAIDKDDLQKRLQAAFKVEVKDRLQIMSSDLIKLEQVTVVEECDEIVESIFRQAHSLKGASRAVGFSAVEKIATAFESVFSALKNKNIEISPEMMDVVLHATDTLTTFAVGFDSRQPDIHGEQVLKIVSQLNELLLKKPIGKTESVKTFEVETKQKEDYLSAKKPAGKNIQKLKVQKETVPETQSVRVSLEKLDSLMLQAEEMLQAKLLAKQHKSELQKLIEMFESSQKDWAQVEHTVRDLSKSLQKRDNSSRQDKGALLTSINLLELINSNQNHSRITRDHLFTLVNSAHQDQRLIGEQVDRLIENAKDLLMLPFSIFLEMIPKVIRDLARDQKKFIKVTLEGGATEVDRKILEEMQDPLIHLLRNCVDHGVEPPTIREKTKKDKEGVINVAIEQVSGNKVQIVISDDGAGVNVEELKKAAIQKQVLSRQEADQLTTKDAFDLIFKSGLTTSSIITDISGRGLGMAIVHEKVEKLGGEISVESLPGQGTTFRILLPITLATFRGVQVMAGEQQFIVPTAGIDRIVRVNQIDIRTIQNRDTIILDKTTIPLVRLSDVMEIPHRDLESTSELVPVMVLGKKEKQVAFSLDHVLGEDEILFKSLGSQLTRVRNIYGATVLSNRKLVPILNVTDLLKSAVHIKPMVAGKLSSSQQALAVQKSILVAEDSITSRMLLKTILESGGYKVTTAVDGLEALTELKEGEYDLIVSDVDMPRMNGFVLTEKIRADKRLGELPVILVTSLQSREDREHGIDVGANAYIIKSSFDQSNLLEVIQKCI